MTAEMGFGMYAAWSVTAVALALFFVIVYAYRKHESEFLLFALVCLGVGMHTLGLAGEHIAESDAVWHRVAVSGWRRMWRLWAGTANGSSCLCPTEMWWKMEVPNGAPAKVLRFDAEQLGKTQFVFCDRDCENEWADTLQCRICGGTEWKRSKLPSMASHDTRRLILEESWLQEAVKRGKTAAKQVQLCMIHPVRSKELEQRRRELYRIGNNESLAKEVEERELNVCYTTEEVKQRQAQLFQVAYEDTLAALEAGSMKAEVLHAPICDKECTGAAQSTMGPRLNRERVFDPIVAGIGHAPTVPIIPPTAR